jgi:hypothetical protein
MLPGVQQHPNLALRRPGENARKHAAAAQAGVVLLYSCILHGARAIERQVFV